MNKKTRTILFLICFLLFITIAPLAVLYSQGYRIDLNSNKGLLKISQTGGLFLKVLPRQADVYINEKLNKKTDFFFGSILIENLLPRKHKIEIKKQGYHSWEKNLEIKEKEVVEAKDIVLFPLEINFSLLTNETQNIWLSPDHKKIVSLERNLFNNESETDWALKLFDLEKDIKSQLILKNNISKEEIELIDLNFSENSKKIFLEAYLNNNKEEIKRFSLEIDKGNQSLLEEEIPLIITENIEEIACFKIINNDLYYLDKNGVFFKNIERISQENFLIEEECYLSYFENYIFLKHKGNLYKFDSNLNFFEPFFEKIISFKFSPDKKKMIYFSNHEIWVLFLKDDQSSIQRKSDENILLIRISEPIKDVSWLNNHYLIFIANNNLKITEIDNRDRVNIIDILKTTKLPDKGSFVNVFFSLFDKRIYLLNENNFLYQSETVLP